MGMIKIGNGKLVDGNQEIGCEWRGKEEKVTRP